MAKRQISRRSSAGAEQLLYTLYTNRGWYITITNYTWVGLMNGNGAMIDKGALIAHSFAPKSQVKPCSPAANQVT